MSKHEENMFGSTAWNTFNDEYENSGIEENFSSELNSDKAKVANTLVEQIDTLKLPIYNIYLDIDISDSMNAFSSDLERVLETIKNVAASRREKIISISKTMFSDVVYHEKYTEFEQFDTKYSSDFGCTSFIDSIVSIEKRINSFRNELHKNGIDSENALIILSDGIDDCSKAISKEAKECIKRLKVNNVIICFISFGNRFGEDIARDLGITNVVNNSVQSGELYRIIGFDSVGL